MSFPTEEATREVNLTPLIDVSLVLVVMLLLMTPLALESSFAVQRAADAGREEERDEIERVEVGIAGKDDIVVNRLPVPRPELARTIAGFLAGTPLPVVVISCEDHVPHGVFVEVIDTVKSAGAGEIAVIGK